MKKRVLFMFGGDSTEHDISYNSLKSILGNIDKDKYEIGICGIKNHVFYLVKDLNDEWLENSTIINNLSDFKNYDVVFPIIHGMYGEDGRLQGMLDLLNIPYVGSGVMGSFIGMDKGIFKIIMDNLGIPQVPYKVLDKPDAPSIDYPVMIKPCNGGSSIGINKANNDIEYIKACYEALKLDKRIVIEKWIKAREIEVAILEIGGKIIVSTPGEIISNGFYDYNSKYLNKTEVKIPAVLDEDIKNKITEYALMIFNYLDCSSLARIDFFLEDNNLYINEINTVPGFNIISMYPKLFNYDGINYSDLIDKLIESARKKV